MMDGRNARNIDELSKAVLASVQSEPHRWVKDAYTIERDDGLAVWHANGASFAKFYKPAIWPTRSNLLFGFLVPWRRRLMLAAKLVADNDGKAVAKLLMPEAEKSS